MEEYAHDIAEAYSAAGLDAVNRLLGRVALRADEAALQEFKELHYKYKPVDRAPPEWLEIP